MILRVDEISLDFPLSPGETGTDQTVEAMRAVIDDAQCSSFVVVFARALGTVDDLWEFLRTRVAFKADPDGVEFIRLPEVMLQEIGARGMAVGDCDDRAVLGASLAKAAGWDAAVIVMTPFDHDPDFRHVLFAVRPEPGVGRWLAMDAQEGFPPGVWPGAVERAKAYVV